ncbi:hypothetical protein [Gilvimarinus algae]|uniref:Tetratricopeptide repeat protein n=1 Tax=Gilvimarinus algae TaxID=3058037 RepID=A0ABT8TBN1_9GAMM|nr:hypothetical protein [Gilvimarinus sp. SDUM040014]MDO3381509.1 hypothetical protein [Gilvimarinus sp. SDUM040014]
MGAVARRLTLALALAAAGASAADDKHRAAQDLDYGEGLYHYYTGEFPAALTTLELANHRGGIAGHSHYPELMRAGMYLAYGMTGKAEAEFAAHLGQGEPQQVRDTAHFYLARLRYQAGDYASAKRHLDALGDALPESLSDEAALLAVNLTVKTGTAPSLNTAEPLLEPLQDNLHLALLNLGNSAARADDPIRAQSYYKALVEAAPPEDDARVDEYLAIRDKAYTALGYSFLGQRDYASAKAAFREVRLDTALANRALLGYGWAAASYHDYVLALKPWQALRQRSLLDPAVQESLIAVPWAYEQIEAPGAAIAAYRESEQLLTRELTALDQAMTAITPEALQAHLAQGAEHAHLQAGNSSERQNWLTLERVSVLTSDMTYLDPLLRRDQVQAEVQALKDLMDLSHTLQGWDHKLEIYLALIADKRERRRQRAEAIEESNLLSQSDKLTRERETLAQRLESIDREADALALADADTRALYRRLTNARAALEELEGKHRLPPDARAKLELYQGILYWRAAQQFADTRWQAQKQLNQLDASLADSQARSQRIAALLAEDPDIDNQLARLNRARERNLSELEQLNAAIDERAAALASRLNDHLGGHRARLNDYLAQTRLSIARLLDDAYRANAPEDGPQIPQVRQ